MSFPLAYEYVFNYMSVALNPYGNSSKGDDRDTALPQNKGTNYFCDSFEFTSEYRDCGKVSVTSLTESLDGPRHGCRVTGSTVGCADDVYRDPQAWRLSKVAIDHQIRRLRHQLIVMKV